MKNVLICILSIALSAAAFLSRPTERDFRRLVLEHEPGDRASDPRIASATEKRKSRRSARPAQPARRPEARRQERRNPLDGAEFVDRLFWVEIRKDGKTLYAGCFSHWWDGNGKMHRS